MAKGQSRKQKSNKLSAAQRHANKNQSEANRRNKNAKAAKGLALDITKLGFCVVKHGRKNVASSCLESLKQIKEKFDVVATLLGCLPTDPIPKLKQELTSFYEAKNKQSSSAFVASGDDDEKKREMATVFLSEQQTDKLQIKAVGMKMFSNSILKNFADASNKLCDTPFGPLPIHGLFGSSSSSPSSSSFAQSNGSRNVDMEEQTLALDWVVPTWSTDE